jgi:hypothetical protein
MVLSFYSQKFDYLLKHYETSEDLNSITVIDELVIAEIEKTMNLMNKDMDSLIQWMQVNIFNRL